MEDRIAILPGDWQAAEATTPPGVLDRFIPEGFSLGGPAIMRPGDTIDAAFRTTGYYGIDQRSADPILSAPSELPCGGTLYFDEHALGPHFPPILDALGVHRRLTEFAVFAGRSGNTVRDRYLEQLRLVSHAALRQLFGVPAPAVAALGAQNANLEEAIVSFVDGQRRRWSDPRALAGALGGDGDWAKERLAFGLFVENGNWQVIRVWSRPWLVTK
jgi:hypothetical protein